MTSRLGTQLLEERLSGNAKIQYVWSPVYVDALILRDRDTNADGTLDERLYVQQDANFNVTALVNTSGSVVERYAYDPFGVATGMNASWTGIGSSAYTWLYLHQGGRYDSVSGLHHFRNRDYAATLGRWVSVDPSRFGSGTINLYEFVRNRPIGSVDPNGLAEKQVRETYSFPGVNTEVGAVFVQPFHDDLAFRAGAALLDVSIALQATSRDLKALEQDIVKTQPNAKCIAIARLTQPKMQDIFGILSKWFACSNDRCITLEQVKYIRKRIDNMIARIDSKTIEFEYAVRTTKDAGHAWAVMNGRRIYLTGDYFRLSVEGQVTLLLHELSHNLGTDDYGYWDENRKSWIDKLGEEGKPIQLSTEKCLDNAQSYEHFVEDLGHGNGHTITAVKKGKLKR